jgi:indoleacetamide hydrolase
VIPANAAGAGFCDARGAAREVDEGVRTGPLAGLPIVVKDNIRTQGLPNAAGTPALKEAIADANAPVLQRLVDAGAIVVSTTHMYGLAFGISGWFGSAPDCLGDGIRSDA